MKKTILVSDDVRTACHDMYEELMRLLKEKFAEGESKVYTIQEYKQFRREERASIMSDLRFGFFHVDAPPDLIKEAFDNAVPVILIRSDEISDDWCWRLEEWGVAETKDLECIKKMIYMIDKEADDIRGAIRWVNNFYHPIKERLDTRSEIERARTIEDFKRILRS